MSVRYSDHDPYKSNLKHRERWKSNLKKLFIMLFVISSFFIFVLKLVPIIFLKSIPFHVEKSIAEKLFNEDEFHTHKVLDETFAKIKPYMNIPGDITITLLYAQDNYTVNAYAFPGGYIVVFSGLYNKLRYQEELASIIAHEVSHVIHRDTARNFGWTLASAAVFSNLSESELINAISDSRYSQSQERTADAFAVATIGKAYGHTEGTVKVYELLRDLSKNHNEVSFYSSHPESDERIADVVKLSKKLGFPINGRLTLLRR